MSHDLSGRRIAFLTAQVGVEKAELTDPWKTVTEAGADAVHVAPDVDEVQSMVGDTDKDEVFEATLAVADASADDFDALVLPGGTVNADKVRGDAASVALVKAFVDAGKPVAAAPASAPACGAGRAGRGRASARRCG